MTLAWEKKVRLTHLYFKIKTLLEHLQKNKYKALYPIQKNQLALYFARKTLYKIGKC